MTQGELEKLSIPVSRAFSNLEARIMADIVRRIKINGFSTASADWQISRLQQLGESEEDIKKWIKEILELSDKEIEKIFSDEVYRQYYGHDRAYTLKGMRQIPLEENVPLQELTEAVKQQTGETFRNITGSLGFVKQDAAGHIQPVSLSDFYRNSLDMAMYDIHSGAFDYQTVLMRTIMDMTKSGLRWIDYESGWHNRVDVAARRAVMTGFRQVQGKINEQVAAELGTDCYEVTYHVGARPTHQIWQGKVWTMQQLKDVCGLGTGPGLHGWNCYHDYNPFIPGVSVRTYTDKQLKEMNEKENTPKSYNGKEYTTYEALQKQRKMETAMRATRQQISLMKEGGSDEQSIILKKARYQGQMQTYKDFSRKMGLPEQMDRVYQDGLSGKFMPTKGEIKKIEKPVAKGSGSGIIKTRETLYEGIPRNWKRLEKADDSLKAVNPNFDRKSKEYSTNCVNCISAYEMRQRGYNVTAAPATKNHFLSQNPEAAWIEPDVKPTKGSGLEDILYAAEEWPEGARAEIAVRWKYGDKGHVFVAEKVEGVVKFYDVQSGEEHSEGVFNRVKKNGTRFWRIDNIEPSDRGITACKAGD